MKEWHTIDNKDTVDSPSLVIYPERVQENIRLLKTAVPETHRLRPHVKTHKSGEVSALLIKAGIKKFKCATIAEGEMLAKAGAADVLLAYQPVGPKAIRLMTLAEKFPNTLFSCLIDNLASASWISSVFDNAGLTLNVFIDLNIGMNRTGIVPELAEQLYDACQSLPGLKIAGLHAYDGHLRDPDLAIRTAACNKGFEPVPLLAATLQKKQDTLLSIVAGGTTTFPIHSKRKEVECSPGTFIYWDYGYKNIFTEQPWIYAALVITRIISKPTDDSLCLDLGHKSIASENPLHQRVHFLNAPDFEPIGHSEEHLVVHTKNAAAWKVGDVIYGVPFHICPTCALYDSAAIVEDNTAVTRWSILSRNKIITV